MVQPGQGLPDKRLIKFPSFASALTAKLLLNTLQFSTYVSTTLFDPIRKMLDTDRVHH